MAEYFERLQTFDNGQERGKIKTNLKLVLGMR